MSELDRIALNECLVSRLLGLKHMYQQATEDAKNERMEEVIKGWEEWAELDAESKAFVLDYLKK